MNAQSFPLQIISSSSFFIAIFMAVLMADMISEEYRQGTLKLILVHPVKRAQLATAKALTAGIALLVIIVFTLISSYLIGFLFFHWGDGIFVQNTPLLVHGNPLEGIRGIFCTLLASGGFMLSAFGLSMIILFLAFLSENTAVTIGIGVALVLLSNLAMSVDFLKNYFVGTYMNSLPSMIMTGAHTSQILTGIFVSIAYVVIFYLASTIFISRKDVL